MSVTCDVTSLQHPAALSMLIGRDESRDTTGTAPDIGPPTQSGMVAGSSGSVPGGSAGGRSAWRCDVCGYSTMVARNLRIHMTSEKHTHNVALLQCQQQHHQSQQMRLQQQLATSYHHGSVPSLPWPGAGPPAAPFLPLSTSVDLSRPCAQQRSTRPTTSSQPGQHHQNGQTWSDSVAGRASGGPQYTCNLCPYRTTLRANFHLHCQTDKHAQRVQQFALTVAGGGGATNMDLVVPSPSQADSLRSSAADSSLDDIKPGRKHALSCMHRSKASFLVFHVRYGVTRCELVSNTYRSHSLALACTRS